MKLSKTHACILITSVLLLPLFLMVPTAFGAYEDFTTWSECGADKGKLGQTTTRSNWTSLKRMHTADCYKAGTYSDWSCAFDINFSMIEAGDASNREFLRIGGSPSPCGVGSDGFWIKPYQLGSTDNAWRIWFEHRVSGKQKLSFFSPSGSPFGINTMYYFYFAKQDKLCSIGIYNSTENRATNSSALFWKSQNSTHDTTYGYWACPSAMQSSAPADGEDRTTGYVENFQWDFEFEEAGETYYYFNFDWCDLNNNQVDSAITWELHNASGDIGYTEGSATLTESSYTLKTYRHGHLINSTEWATATYGNKTLNTTLQMKATNFGYVVCSNTISTLTFQSQLTTNFTFTLTGSTPMWVIVDVSGEPIESKKDGVGWAGYTYDGTTSPAHLHMNMTSLSVFYFRLYEDTSGPSGPSGPGGPSGGQHAFWRLQVFVNYAGEPVHLAEVEIWNTTMYGMTDVFGRHIFRVDTGVYKIEANHEDYGSRWVTVSVEDHTEVGIDLAKPQTTDWVPYQGPTELPEGSEWFLLAPVAVLAVFALSKALKGPSRKWRYSYLK